MVGGGGGGDAWRPSSLAKLQLNQYGNWEIWYVAMEQHVMNNRWSLRKESPQLLFLLVKRHILCCKHECNIPEQFAAEFDVRIIPCSIVNSVVNLFPFSKEGYVWCEIYEAWLNIPLDSITSFYYVINNESRSNLPQNRIAVLYLIPMYDFESFNKIFVSMSNPIPKPDSDLWIY